MSTCLPLADAAFRLGLDYHRVRALLFRGELTGGRDDFGRLYVDLDAVEAYRRRHPAPSPRSLRPRPRRP